MRTERSQNFIELPVVRANHAALNSGHVMSKIETEITGITKAADLPALKSCAMRLADILNQKNILFRAQVNQLLCKTIDSQNVRQKDCPCIFIDVSVVHFYWNDPAGCGIRRTSTA